MASASRGESSNPYGGGLGTGGKFRKPTARRSQKTPYERPPTSVRGSGVGGGREDRGGGGWLSKLVDPAQRLITYSAHKLFASVFRKRLVSGETPLQSPEQQRQLPERDVIQETRVAHMERTPALSTKNDVVRIQEGNASGNPGKDGFMDLEKMLKEKTFTRSEVDRLTSLLRSKAADSSTVNGDQRNDASNLRHPPTQARASAHPDNGSMNALVSAPLGSSRALDEGIASPAQLAKAYMGSRPSEVTPSMLGLRGQAVREDSVFQNRTPFPSKSPTMSLVPKLSGQRPQENGFLTPRTRGRSAVYSMARTPYSRPQSTAKIGSPFQSPPSTWDETLSSGSRHGFQSGLKRRSSVLDNGIGSVGPVRRIRQKSNLSSRSLALPASEGPLSVRASGGQNITHTAKDSAEDIPGSSFNLVPSRSKDTAMKIFQQLEKMDSPKEKSPSKLSPSMLRGPALKSLQNVESLKFLDNIPEKKANSPVSSHQKQEKSGGSGSREFLALSVKTGSAADDTNKAGSSKDQETRVKGDYLPLTSSLEEHPPKKRSFRMTADEDLEDEHVAATTPFEEAEKQNVLKVEKGVGVSVPKGEKLSTSSETIASTSYTLNGDASQSTSNGSLETGRSQFSAFPMESVKKSNMPSEPTSKVTQGNEKSSISPTKTSGGDYISREEPKKDAAVFPNLFSSPAATDFLNQNNGTSAAIKLEKPSSFAFGVSEAFGKPTESKKTVSNSASGAESTTLAESTLNGSIFSGGANAISQPQFNGSLGSNPSFSSSISNTPSNNSASEVPCTVQSSAATLTSPSVFGKIPAASSVFGNLPANTSNDSNSGNNPLSTAAPPLSSASPFKFGEPAAAPLSTSTVSAPSAQVSKETEVKNPTFGNINSFKFGGMASAGTSTENTVAAKTSDIKSTPGFMFGSSPAVADAGTFSFGGTSSAAGGSTLIPSLAAPGSSASFVFGVSSSSTPTPGTESSKFSGTFATTTGSNIFGTSSPAFTSSGSSVSGGVAASTASSVFGFNAVSSASGASSQSQASNLFGAANGQTGNIGSGTTTQTQSAPFMFGSSASAPTFGLSGNNTSSNSSPSVFASGSTPQLGSTNSSSSSSGTTSSPLFGTNWQAPKPAPAFTSSFTPSSSPTFSFGGSSAATASSASAPMTFSFNSTAPAIPQQSVFGNSAPSATPPSPFGNSTPSFAFGATATPPNTTNGFNNNNQQMSMEDSMAEDTDQANKTSMVQQPVFGQQPVSMPQPSFTFGGGAPPATPPTMANPFQFGGQPIASTAPQNASPFQASQSLEFQGGGSFSLGSTGGGDKSGRRIIKPRKSNRKK
ncbi:Nuclear pore complex protein NUP1 [Raphanus sativus]|uniref:Nuclear pore complex protein NUP1-like n=1 Tax=Raphanus sativus TaxID=3726 RepID=A0A9W3DU91_RAPSA|nr:nuclear pore complex protein NUP1-like [Raphanus sativus]KAJ4898253.1 Nuclear pore complex protein NUP1 [Raphanus sativus]